MQIRRSAEDYLEAMLMMREKHGYTRSVDVAQALSVSKASVSVAAKKLRENGYITMDPEGRISLTESGMAIAGGIYDRHRLLTRLLIGLGVSESVARGDACRMEHDMSDETFQAIKRHLTKNQAE